MHLMMKTQCRACPDLQLLLQQDESRCRCTAGGVLEVPLHCCLITDKWWGQLQVVLVRHGSRYNPALPAASVHMLLAGTVILSLIQADQQPMPWGPHTQHVPCTHHALLLLLLSWIMTLLLLCHLLLFVLLRPPAASSCCCCRCCWNC